MKRHIHVHKNRVITINTRYHLNFYKTSITTSLMLNLRFTNSETMPRDHVNSLGGVLIKRGFFWQVSILGILIDLLWTESLLSQGTVFFFQVVLSEIKTGSFSHEFSCSDARNKIRTGALLRISNYLTEHLDLQGCGKYIPIILLRIKEDVILFPESKQVPQWNT